MCKTDVYFDDSLYDLQNGQVFPHLEYKVARTINFECSFSKLALESLQADKNQILWSQQKNTLKVVVVASYRCSGCPVFITLP